MATRLLCNDNQVTAKGKLHLFVTGILNIVMLTGTARKEEGAILPR